MALIGVTGGQTWPPVTTPDQGGSVQEYDVVVNGVKTTMLLSDRDAAARGLTPAEPETADEPEAKAHTPENKARTPANKNADKRAEAAARAFGGGGSKSDDGPDAG